VPLTILVESAPRRPHPLSLRSVVPRHRWRRAMLEHASLLPPYLPHAGDTPSPYCRMPEWTSSRVTLAVGAVPPSAHLARALAVARCQHGIGPPTAPAWCGRGLHTLCQQVVPSTMRKRAAEIQPMWPLFFFYFLNKFKPATSSKSCTSFV
jgi:hypothetical protein